MNHRHALWLMGPMLCALAAHLLVRSADPHADPGPPPQQCRRWVQVGAPHTPVLCLDRRPATRLRQAGVCIECLRRVEPRTLRPGDRLHRPGQPDCQRRRMPAGHLITLGLPVDLNRANAAELATLPGIGLKLARRIRTYRQRHGPFQQPQELLEVRGIGRKLLKRLRKRLGAM